MSNARLKGWATKAFVILLLATVLGAAFFQVWGERGLAGGVLLLLVLAVPAVLAPLLCLAAVVQSLTRPTNPQWIGAFLLALLGGVAWAVILLA